MVNREFNTVRPVASGFRYFRWIICAVLFFGVTKNYMDRQILGVLKTTLQQDLGWSEVDYGNIVFAFQTFYAIGMLLGGRLVDRHGTRITYALAMVFWSLASMAHAAMSSVFGFQAARAALGLGESSVFPCSIKAVAEWFPKKDRAFATGIFNAGTNVGAILTPLLIPWITVHFGWRWGFIITGAVGFLWLIFWLALYRRPEEHPRCTPWELAYIRSDPQESMERVPWLRLLRYRQMWAFAIAKFLTDPVWWFYLFWIPDFLQRKHGLSLTQVAVPIMAIYIISDVGSVVGGWLSSWMIKRGSSINAARKSTMLLCGLCVLPVVLAYYAGSLWTAVLLIGLAAAAHQGFSANLFTLSSDMFPSRAVGSVVGIGGMGGAIGGMFVAQIVGHVLQWTGSYLIPFLIAAPVYLVAVGIIQLLAPRLEPAKLT
jgi:ACS family hexuronate transporter-like MFS transporter